MDNGESPPIASTATGMLIHDGRLEGGWIPPRRILIIIKTAA